MTPQLAIVTVVGPESRAGPRLVRAARRVAHSLRARFRAAHASRALRREGYADVSVLFWDLARRVRLPGLTQGAVRSCRATRSSSARRGATEPTAVESALAAAGGLSASWASTRAGLVVVGS